MSCLAQVRSLVKLGLLQRACEIAQAAQNRAAIQLVAAEAARLGNLDVVALCTAYMQSNERDAH